MAEIHQSSSGPSFSSLLAPFTGVDNATARLLKAISASEFATLRDGDLVYVESVRDYWKWVPTSTVTDDSTGVAAKLRYCNPTINGANPGRFERMFFYSPDWRLQDFTIDSAIGNNEADGVVTPLNNDNELAQRWGTDVLLDTPRTVTYAQSPTTETNFAAIRILLGGSLTFLGAQTITKSGLVLTAVAAQVRTPGAEVPWAVTEATLGAADVGNLMIITASGIPANVGAYARILKNNGAGSVRVSPFGTFVVSDVAPFVQITPAVGDTVKVVTLTTLKIGRIRLISEFNATLAQAAPTRQCVVFDSILLEGSATTGNGTVQNDFVSVFYARAIAQNLNFAGTVVLVLS
jgi:hypothetical protein